ncbi:hypothetical protein ACQ4PT_067027 [Festuca glaucescens]
MGLHSSMIRLGSMEPLSLAGDWKLISEPASPSGVATAGVWEVKSTPSGLQQELMIHREVQDGNQMASLTSSWVMNLCGSPICSDRDVASCALKQIFDSSTCMNHLVEVGIVLLFVVVLALQLLAKIPKSRASGRQLVTPSSPLHLAAVVSNGSLGLVYLGLGLWMLGSNFNQDASVYLPHWWLLTLFQGLNLILASFAFSISYPFLGAMFVRFWSVLLTIYAAFVCCSSVVDIVTEKAITVKACSDLLSLPGAILLLLYGFRRHHDEEGDGGLGNGLYKPLNTGTDGEVANSKSQVTPFAKAGYFSEMSFWWLNPLFKMGYGKPLEDKDLPLLGTTDRAQNQYMMFMEKLNGEKQSPSHATPSIFWTIVSCHKRGILVSGFFGIMGGGIAQ